MEGLVKMEVKQAARIAKEYVRDLFAEETISDAMLEEVEFDNSSDVWKITIGFTREWSAPNVLQSMAASLGGVTARRVYKIVNVNNSDGSVKSVKHRSLD